MKAQIPQGQGPAAIAQFSASSVLFVPGSRPERFAKARDACAGVTVIDLEDAVPAADKDAARDAALSQMASGGAGWAIRLNAVSTTAGIADLHALASAEALPEFLFMTMVEDAAEARIVSGALGEKCPPLVPTIETPRGLRNALDIANGSSVAAIMFGGGDFSAELGVDLAWEPLLAARQQLLLATGEARIASIDVPFIHLDDETGLADECAKSRSIGFTCKAAIHPRQLPAIEKAFAPTVEEVEEAKSALAAYDDAGGKVIRHKGRMLEAPLVKQYRAVLARSKEMHNA